MQKGLLGMEAFFVVFLLASSRAGSLPQENAFQCGREPAPGGDPTMAIYQSKHMPGQVRIPRPLTSNRAQPM